MKVPDLTVWRGDGQCVYRHVRARSWQSFPLRGQMVNSQGFVGQVVSVAAIKLCFYLVQTAMDNMYVNGHRCVLLGTTDQVVGWIW